MLTNNFYYSMASLMFNSSTPSDYYIKLPDGSTKSCTYNAAKAPTAFVGNTFVKSTGSYGFTSYGVCFGRGSTPATKEDYKLEDMITSELSLVANSSTVAWDDNGVEVISSFTLKNASDGAIEISEVGSVGQCYNGNTSYYPLVDRTVLDVPVTIPAGETKLLSYAIRINYPA